MDPEQYSRSDALFGAGATASLRQKHVAVFGLGGVGSYLVEALARMGVGRLTLVDRDEYTISNCNRQLYALPSTVGRAKVDVAKERVALIDAEIRVDVKRVFVLPETVGDFDFSSFDYVADAIDTVSAKLALAEAAKKAGVPIVMAMGAGNKCDPTRFRVSDIAETKVCPLARVIRTECNKRGLCGIKAVWSDEPPHASSLPADPETGKSVPASCSFVPSVVGLIMAGEIVKDLLGEGTT